MAYRIGDGADAEDVTSDVFERALRYRHGYDSRKGDPAAWLLGIARRCVAAWASARAPVGEARDRPSQERLEDEAIGRLTVRAHVAKLDERDRELVALRYGADLTARQIAEVLGTTTNAVEVALHRALGRLRAGFDDDARRVAPRKGLTLQGGKSEGSRPATEGAHG